jgi:hypothetical protein
MPVYRTRGRFARFVPFVAFGCFVVASAATSMAVWQ